MSGSIYMTATGALAYEKRLQLLANNLANVDTVGFKKDRGRFRAFDLTEAMNSKKIPVKWRQSQAPNFWMEYRSYTDFSAGGQKKNRQPIRYGTVW